VLWPEHQNVIHNVIWEGGDVKTINEKSKNRFLCYRHFFVLMAETVEKNK